MKLQVLLSSACISALLSACSGGAAIDKAATSSPVQSSTPAPSTAAASPSEATALWPETDRSEVPAAFPAWRMSASDTVAHFAQAILGWHHPVVRPWHPAHQLQPGERSFEVSSASASAGAGAAIEVVANRVVDARHWSVTYLWGFGNKEPQASVSITTAHAHVSFNYWGRSASARLLLIYGRNKVRQGSTHAAAWDVPLSFPINVAGAVIVTFSNAAGEVVTGWGTALPAGPFTAG